MTESLDPLIGGDIFELITVGMYNDPLAIYREYIQNSADALSLGAPDRGLVEVRVDLPRARVRIRDNGPGLSYSEAVRALLPIGRSEKRRGHDRGFRGIGRLSALAFADTVVFVTRRRGSAPVTRVKWNGVRLRDHVRRSHRTEDAIRECVEIETEAGCAYPDHFFDVEIEGIGRQAASRILNRDRVRSYIGEVCPVPISSEFRFAPDIDALFTTGSPPLALRIVVDDDSVPITRGYQDRIQFGSDRQDVFLDFEGFRVPTTEGKEVAAVGWIAHSSYLGAIPREVGIRGIRARCGNIQIGDEAVFDDVFQEERFNRWCVGEVHVLDPRVVPNGRRDYFEPGPHIRNLENRLDGIFRDVVARCRHSSSTRNRERRLASELTRIEEVFDLADSGYLAEEDVTGLVVLTLERLSLLRSDVGHTDNKSSPNSKKLEALEQKYRNFKVAVGCASLAGIAPSEMETYRKIFRVLAMMSPSARVAKEMIEAVIAETP